MEDIRARIEREVTSWEGVTAAPHRFGGVEFLLGRRKLGHLHGDRVADLPFTRRIRDMLIETGRAEANPYAPDTGWVTRPIESEDDVAEVVELFRLSYERASVARAVAAARSAERS